jgi:hypothetical protein
MCLEAHYLEELNHVGRERRHSRQLILLASSCTSPLCARHLCPQISPCYQWAGFWLIRSKVQVESLLLAPKDDLNSDRAGCWPP